MPVQTVQGFFSASVSVYVCGCCFGKTSSLAMLQGDSFSVVDSLGLRHLGCCTHWGPSSYTSVVLVAFFSLFNFLFSFGHFYSFFVSRRSLFPLCCVIDSSPQFLHFCCPSSCLLVHMLCLRGTNPLCRPFRVNWLIAFHYVIGDWQLLFSSLYLFFGHS